MNKKNIDKIKNIIDDKLKPLFPTLRTKKRFIKIKINSNKKFDFKELSEGLNSALLDYMGILNFGRSGLWILKDKFNQNKQELVLKVSVKYKNEVAGILSIIDKINSIKVNIEVIKISGTLKSLEKERK